MPQLLFLNLSNIGNDRRALHLQLITDTIEFSFGRITDIRVPELKKGQTVRHAFVTYEDPGIGSTVKRQYNGYEWQGQIIEVEIKTNQPTTSQNSNINQPTQSTIDLLGIETALQTDDQQISFIIQTQTAIYTNGTSNSETQILYQAKQ